MDKKEEIIKRFYTLTVYDENHNSVEWDQDKPFPSYYSRKKGWNYCVEVDDNIIIDDRVYLNEEIIDLYNKNKDKYDFIYIKTDTLNGVNSKIYKTPVMVGVIKEKKILKFQKKREIVEAEQWFPEKEVEGVCNGTSNALCGCVLLGGDTKPHIHSSGCRISINPGDWIIKHPPGVNFSVCKPYEFEQTYELIE